MRSFNLNLNEKELDLLLSSLLFVSSVNVVMEDNEEYPTELIDLAKKIKCTIPDIKLKHAQFIKEENYEDKWSEDVYANFHSNLKTTTFDFV